MPYDPYQFSVARANVIGGMTSGIEKAVVDTASKIAEISKQKGINEKINGLYKETVNRFVTEMKEADPSISDEKARITAMKKLPSPMEGMSSEDNLKNLLAASLSADKYIEELQKKTKATQFTKAAEQPVSETRQIQAEGPPIQQGERVGEVPMEQQTIQRPMRYEEYEKGYEALEPETRKMIPESVGARVKTTESVYQQPLKTFETEREASVKERENNIKTMSGIDKGAGFHTAIIESQKAVDKLKSKKSTLEDLIKTVSKSEGLSMKQIEQGKQKDLEMEIDQISQELNIPQQLAHNDEFLGRMKEDIDRLVAKEEDWQKGWETAYDEMKKREEMNARRKGAPTPTPDWKLGKELQNALEKMAKQQFPNLFKVIEGEYGIDVLKQTSGIAEAARAILRDPQKRIALAYAFPEEVGAIARAKGAPRPSDAEIQSVLNEMQQLQNQVYGVIEKTPSSQSEDIFSGLGGLQ